ncbi:6-hydroxymethylpterin diphosphokinase MptE-like protein [Sulfurimonas sp.]|uniref:6-hydroxymethylpterin diphosphokinase MptE-like protein n=1 Tax=Sulfurimonas sp. TaxID=2022749 RepID=UPI00356A8C30
MIDINTLITTNFKENTSYLESYHPKLFDKIVAIEKAIENNHYQEKYELVYENGNFDVLEKATETLLYNKDSQKHADLAVKSINFENDNSLFETFHKRVVSDDDVKLYEDKEPFMNHLSGFAPIINHIQKNYSINDGLERIEKFIFFGSGLGLHINKIDKKLSSKVYLIVEDDLELFRLSLFTINYKELSKKSELIFSIFEDKDEFSNTVERFLTTKYFYNHYIKYFHMLNHNLSKQDQMHLEIVSQPHLTFYYHSMLKHYVKPFEYLFDDYNFLNKSLTFSDKVLRDKPFLFLAAGPSLQKNIAWLKNNYKNFIIVAIGATLPFLEKEGISPNIIVQLDGHLESIKHFKAVKSLDFISESIYIFSDKVPKEITNLLSKKQLFLFEHSTKYREKSLRPVAPCVGSTGLQLLILLRVKQIYILGLDMAIDQETGKTHVDTHVRVSNIDIEENIEDKDNKDYTKSLIKVNGNMSEFTYTTPHFMSSINIVNHSLEFIKQENQSVINLGDGIKFNNTISMRSDKLDCSIEISREKIQKHIQKICIRNSSNKLTSSELKTINDKHNHAKSIKILLDEYKNTQSKSNKQYLENLIKFSDVITNQQSTAKYELSLIYNSYLRYILPYIFNYLDNKLVNNDAYMDINKLLIDHMIKIVNYYCESLSVYIDK